MHFRWFAESFFSSFSHRNFRMSSEGFFYRIECVRYVFDWFSSHSFMQRAATTKAGNNNRARPRRRRKKETRQFLSFLLHAWFIRISRVHCVRIFHMHTHVHCALWHAITPSDRSSNWEPNEWANECSWLGILCVWEPYRFNQVSILFLINQMWRQIYVGKRSLRNEVLISFLSIDGTLYE